MYRICRFSQIELIAPVDFSCIFAGCGCWGLLGWLSHAAVTNMPSSKTHCTCAKAALDFDRERLELRTAAIQILDDILHSLVERDLLVLLKKSWEHVDKVAKAEKDKQAEEARQQRLKDLAAEKASKDAAAATAKAEKEAAKATAKAEAEAAKAIQQANDKERARDEAIERARVKAQAELKAQAKREEQARQAEAAQRDIKAAKEARAAEAAAAKAEKEVAAAKAAEEKAAAQAAAQALKEEARLAKAAAAAKEAQAAAERKAWLDQAMAEAEEQRIQAAALARAEAERAKIEAEQAKAADVERQRTQAPPRSPSSTAGNVAQQRLERSTSRFGLRKKSQEGNGDAGPHGNGSASITMLAERDDSVRGLRTNETSTIVSTMPELLTESDSKSSETLLQPWRDGGTKKFELDADINFSGDCVAYDDDGDTLACIGGDGDGSSVSIYSARKGQVLKNMKGHSDLVCCVALHGDCVASAGRDKTIRLWSCRKGQCTATLIGCEDVVYGLAMRGDTLLSGEGKSKAGKVRTWSIRRECATATFSEHTGPVWSVALGDHVAVSASYDTTAKLWPLEVADHDPAPKSKATLAHPNWVFSVSVEGTLAATGCGDRIVRLWSLSSFTCLRSLVHGSGWASNAVFSVRLAGGILVTGSEDKLVRLWSLAGDCECVATLTHGAVVKGVTFSRAGGFIASTGGDVKKLTIWSPTGSAATSNARSWFGL